MVMSLLVLGFVVASALVWMARGAFSAFLHLLCCFVAGAIAFGLWEFAAIPLKNVAPNDGFFSMVQTSAHTIAIIGIFTIALLILRVITDKAVPANLHLPNIVNTIGGVLFGSASGVLVAGIVVIAIGFSRLPTQALGYAPLYYRDGTPNLTKGGIGSGKLWLPADWLVSEMYGTMSRTSLHTRNNLDRYYPDFYTAGPALRVNDFDGKTRNTINPEHFSVLGAYLMGEPGDPRQASELMVDAAGAQIRYTDVGGDPVSTGYVYGLAVEFRAGQRESNVGQVVVGQGSARLVVENPQTRESQVIYPFGIVARADASEDLYGYFPFRGEDSQFASLGAGDLANFAFEFFIPAGFQPVAAYVRDHRVDLDRVAPEPRQLGNPTGRMQAVRSKQLFSGTTRSPVVTDGAVAYTEGLGNGRRVAITGNNDLFFVINRQYANSLTFDSERRVSGGRQRFDPGQLNQIPANNMLAVRRLSADATQVVIQVNIDPQMVFSLQTPTASAQDLTETLTLIDTNGVRYPPVGYIYEDTREVDIRFTPADPITGTNDIPRPARDGQTTRVIYLVSKNADLRYFALGDQVLVEFVPPIETEGIRMR